MIKRLHLAPLLMAAALTCAPAAAKDTGLLAAAKAKNITKAAFDRGHYRYGERHRRHQAVQHVRAPGRPRPGRGRHIPNHTTKIAGDLGSVSADARPGRPGRQSRAEIISSGCPDL